MKNAAILSSIAFFLFLGGCAGFLGNDPRVSDAGLKITLVGEYAPAGGLGSKDSINGSSNKIVNAVIDLIAPDLTIQTAVWNDGGANVFVFNTGQNGIYWIRVTERDISNNVLIFSNSFAFAEGYNYYITIDLGGSIFQSDGGSTNTNGNGNSNTIFFQDESLLGWLRNNTSPFTGMPLSYYVMEPRTENYSLIGKQFSTTGIIERTILEEGISIYDSAVWQIVLANTGRPDDLVTAAKPIGYYWNGALGGLSSIRTGATNHQGFVYDPTAPDAVTYQKDGYGRRGFIFRILDAYGNYQLKDPLDGKTIYDDFPNNKVIHWEDWKPVSGENAWVVMAALHVLANRFPAGNVDTGSQEFRLSEELARAASFLQAENGGIRMAPLGTYYHLSNVTSAMTEDEIDAVLDVPFQPQPSNTMRSYNGISYGEYHLWYYEEISTENNLSWYAAFRMLWQITGRAEYKTAMDRIENYLRSVWDPAQGIFHQGAHCLNGVWSPNPGLFASDVQNWSIVVLGPQKLDEWFGAGSARRIWEKTKELSGVLDPSGKLAGIGFTSEHDRVSIEWTAGAILAVRMLKAYYRTSDAVYFQTLDENERTMRTGVDSCRFMQTFGDAYSYSSRRGWIPFGWFSQNKEVLSLVSTGWMELINTGINPFVLP